MKKISTEQRLEQIERNISDFERILKQEDLNLDLACEMIESVKFWKKQRTRLKREIRAKEKKAGKEAGDERNA